ncbi:hypothetical protein J2X19_000725 [Rhodoferax ferrireducens]|uniref:Uncharacterized protein n=1 Tax=Rhodoferax ferrireducens TaxID=192843 RepID=A0ABU2C493_9BURK|nr:hypothetical protein [Rhodoferax ferrireducens]MDR7376067.1 hypothetical protein [Rhodoferax ferrireducens]
MKTYSERSGRQPDFLVQYQFLTIEQGGRKGPPHQRTRWDFMYEGDAPSIEGVSTIWLEAISESGEPLPEGEIPASGKAHMFIVNHDRRGFHKARIAPGVRGFFMEGAKRVATCQVLELMALSDHAASP